MSAEFEFKAGMVVITEGNRKSLHSWAVRIGSSSWWTHSFVVGNDDTLIEATTPAVQKVSLTDRLNELVKQKRDYVVLDLPNITDEERQKVVAAAESFIGRKYAISRAILFGITHVWTEGTTHMFCSRMCAASFYKGLNQKHIFNNFRVEIPEKLYKRTKNLNDGYCVPEELLLYSDLEVKALVVNK